MKKRLFILFIITVFALVGCAEITTIIIDPDKKTWTIISKSDARVIITQEKEGQVITIIEVDNRGKTSWVEGLMQYILAKPDITLSNKEGR